LHGLMIIPIILPFSIFLNPSGIYLPRVKKKKIIIIMIIIIIITFVVSVIVLVLLFALRLNQCQ